MWWFGHATILDALPSIPNNNKEKLMKMSTIKIEFYVSRSKLMDNFMGCNWEQDPVAREFVCYYEYRDGDTRFPITYLNEEGTGEITRFIDADDIANALSSAICAGASHCGERIGLEFDDWDACVGTAILQFALYGGELYG